jgi:hypothetical protein
VSADVVPVAAVSAADESLGLSIKVQRIVAYPALDCSERAIAVSIGKVVLLATVAPFARMTGGVGTS